jgi:hypothetical protein
MMPVSYHKNSHDSDVSTLEPYIVLIKRAYNAKQGIQNQIKVIQFPERKTILELDISGKTLINAMYVSDGEFLSER